MAEVRFGIRWAPASLKPWAGRGSVRVQEELPGKNVV